MNPAALIGAGASFAGTVLAGLLLGIWISNRTGQSLWVPAGLFAGFAAGAYAGIRLMLRGN